jgi:glycosyltransferase involved in cell wall biosynthesis
MSDRDTDRAGSAGRGADANSGSLGETDTGGLGTADSAGVAGGSATGTGVGTDSGPASETPAAAEPGVPDGVEHVLLVGPLDIGGGVCQYIDQLVEKLPASLRVETHDTYSPESGSGPLWLLLVALRTVFAAARFTVRSRPDVVHVHSSHWFSFYRASFYVLFARYVWRRPVVLHVHGSSFDTFVREAGPLLAALQRTVLGASDEVVVLSEYWRDVLAERVDRDRVSVVPNAVDPELYEPADDSDEVRVVFVSNLIERKGVEEFLAAVERVSEAAETEFAVDVAGDGPLHGSVEELAAAHEGVEYHGYVSEERKRELLEKGTVFVLPTAAEGLPIAILEAMAGGNAVLSTTVGSIPEVVDEDRGVLVEPGDADALTAALEALVTDPQRAAEMGRENRAAAETRYAWDRAVADLLAIYDDATSGG